MSTMKPDTQLPSGNQAAQVGGVRFLDTAKIDEAIRVVKQERDFSAKLEAVRSILPPLAPLVDELLKAAPWQTRHPPGG